MKVLAKIGLIAAAAAVVLFIFVYEIYKPKGSNQAMKAPPDEEASPYSYYSEEQLTETNTSEAVISELPATEEGSPSTSDEEPIPEDQPDEISEDQPDEISEDLPEENNVAPAEETPVVVPEPPADVNVRRIYGKITLASTGEKVAGVNIMIPGSNVAKISNNIGGYTIQVPQGTKELVFIYRGKKLVQRLSTNNNLLNVSLNLETMQYD